MRSRIREHLSPLRDKVRPRGASFSPSRPQGSGGNMVEVDGLHKRFGDLHVLRGVNLKLGKGEVVVLLGRSGSGKSTLLRCINYLEPFDEGTVLIDGTQVVPDRKILQELRQGVGFVFQQYNLFPHKTALQNVQLGLRVVKRMSTSDATEAAMVALSRVGLADKRDAHPDALSGGQQQRVAIARCLAMAPKVMLLDEITSALDPELIAEVLEVVYELAEAGMTMLIVTHELSFAKRAAARIGFMHEGRILEIGEPRAFFKAPHTTEARRFISAITE